MVIARSPTLLASVLTVAALGFATAGATAPVHDAGRLNGVVVARVPATNTSRVQIEWSFVCVSERAADASYEWTMRLRRILPPPTTTTMLTTGTASSGSIPLTLPPGLYQPVAAPFRCREFGQGVEDDEFGMAFVVPDYCGWTVTAATDGPSVRRQSGTATLELGDVVRPGDVVRTSRFGRLDLGRPRTTLELGPSSQLELRRGDCVRREGWTVVLVRGTLRATTPPAARSSFAVRTRNAVVGAPGATWLVATRPRPPRTTVRVARGRVAITGAGARRVVGLRATAVVAGRRVSVTK